METRKVWWAAAEEPSGGQEQFLVTLVTQLSSNRLPQLKAQCATWAGPIAAVVYMPLLLSASGGGGGGGETASGGGDEEGASLPEAAEEKVRKDIADIEELYIWSAEAARRPVRDQSKARATADEHVPSCSLRIALVLEAFQQERAAAVLYPVSRERGGGSGAKSKS